MKRKRIEVYKRIGLLGLHRSSGVTHLTLLMAQYLKGCLGKKVTVFEKSGRFDLSSLSNDYPVCKKRSDRFQIHGIQFLSDGNMMPEEEYNNRHVIFDFGTNYKGVLEVQKELDILIFVFLNAPWYQAEDLLTRYLEDAASPFKMAVICNMATKKSLEKIPKLPVRPNIIGLEPDFFNPSKEAIQLFETVLYKI